MNGIPKSTCVCVYERVGKYMYLGLPTGGHFVGGKRGLYCQPPHSMTTSITLEGLLICHRWPVCPMPPPVVGRQLGSKRRRSDGKIHSNESLVTVYVESRQFSGYLT